MSIVKFGQVKTKNKAQICMSIKETLKHNTEALDYVTNELNRTKDMLMYNENDVDLLYKKKCLEYLSGTLYFLDDSYMKSLKQLGGKV